MRKQSIFRPSGREGLEVRITPSAFGLMPAAEIVRIDAHVQHARRHHHPKPHHIQPGGGITSSGGNAANGITITGASYTWGGTTAVRNLVWSSGRTPVVTAGGAGGLGGTLVGGFGGGGSPGGGSGGGGSTGGGGGGGTLYGMRS